MSIGRLSKRNERHTVPFKVNSYTTANFISSWIVGYVLDKNIESFKSLYAK